MDDLKKLAWGIGSAGFFIGLGLAAPAIITSITQHERYVLVDKNSSIGPGPSVLDTRTGEICYPGPRAIWDGRSSSWKELKRNCDRIETGE